MTRRCSPLRPRPSSTRIRIALQQQPPRRLAPTERAACSWSKVPLFPEFRLRHSALVPVFRLRSRGPECRLGCRALVPEFRLRSRALVPEFRSASQLWMLHQTSLIVRTAGQRSGG